MSPTPFVESKILDDDILMLRPIGNLDSMSTPEFERNVQEYLEAGHTRIIIDCQRMGYVSSIGIGSLMALQTRLKRKGGHVKLAAIQGAVMLVLRAVHLDRILDIYGDTEFARQSFLDEAKKA